MSEPTAGPPGPYIGPRAFLPGEPIFGRDREADNLFDLLQVERVVLLHSPSGAGKTSLVQAALVPRFRKRRVRVYGPLRVSEPVAVEGKQKHVQSVLRGLAEAVPGNPIPPTDLPRLDLPRFFAEHGVKSTRGKEEFLFFDQFEEILTRNPTDRESKQEFFEQLGRILRATHRSALFAMREEFVAGLDPYLHLIPRSLSVRFRLEFLGADAARDAIVLPARAEPWHVEIKPDAADVLIEDLSRVRVRQPDKTFAYRRGPSIEPVQLQVVCLRLWEGRGSTSVITKDNIPSIVGSVDNALAGYYGDKVRAVAQKTNVPEHELRDWCEQELITPGNTRDQIAENSARAQKLSPAVLQELISAYLVRAEERRDMTWYELAHDRLIDPVRQSNAAYRAAFERSPVSQAAQGPTAAPALPETGPDTAVSLDVEITRDDGGRYLVVLKQRLPDGGETRAEGTMEIDYSQLADAADDPDQYRAVLGRAFYSWTEAATAVEQAFSAATVRGVPLSVRILIGPSASRLNQLCWEVLPFPYQNDPMVKNERVILSRLVPVTRVRPMRLVPRDQVKALIVAACPADVEQYAPGGIPLRHLDLTSAIAAAGQSLSPIPTNSLLGPRTLERVTQYLQQGVEVLYLYCWGTVLGGDAWVWFEGIDGRTVRVSGAELGNRFAEGKEPPRLVVLDLQHGTPKGTSPSLVLARKLVEAGVSAVVAFQEPVPREVATRFLTTVFQQLQQHGRIDLAVASARRAIPDGPDFWKPAILTRGSSVVWSAAAESPPSSPQGSSRGFEVGPGWESLFHALERGQLTPILGPGLYESLFGSSRELARRLVEKFQTTVPLGASDDLATVTQELTLALGRSDVERELDRQLREAIRRRFPEFPDVDLESLMASALAQRRANGELSPFEVLARLPCAVYLTTNLDNQMAQALTVARKAPEVQVCRWRQDELVALESVHNYRPDRARPLVYHLFGRLDQPESLVLTEDDYFGLLTAVARQPSLLPAPVRAALVRSSLLLIGFAPDDWGFRMLLRILAIVVHTGGRNQFALRNVAVLSPSGPGDSPRARKVPSYLDRFLSGSPQVYWGEVADFLKDLAEGWNTRSDASGAGYS